MREPPGRINAGGVRGSGSPRDSSPGEETPPEKASGKTACVDKKTPGPFERTPGFKRTPGPLPAGPGSSIISHLKGKRY